MSDEAMKFTLDRLPYVNELFDAADGSSTVPIYWAEVQAVGRVHGGKSETQFYNLQAPWVARVYPSEDVEKVMLSLRAKKGKPGEPDDKDRYLSPTLVETLLLTNGTTVDVVLTPMFTKPGAYLAYLEQRAETERRAPWRTSGDEA